MGRIWDQKYWQTQRLGRHFVAAQEGKTARRHLDQLEHLLAPHLKRILTNEKATSSEAQELAMGELYQRLSQLREHRGRVPDLESLAEVAAYESLTQYLNEENASRRRLQLLILYILRNRADRFFLGRDTVGLLVAGTAKARIKIQSSRWRRLQAEPMATTAPHRMGLDCQSVDYLPQLLERLLTWLGHRVPVVALVSVIAALDKAPEPTPTPTDEHLQLAEKLEATYLLRQLWEELQTLSTRQRLVVLLGARDASGQSLLLLFCQLGVVSEAGLAQSLEIGPRSFPLLLRELPCDESRLAELVKLTPEAVRQLSLSAKARLRAQLNLWEQS